MSSTRPPTDQRAKALLDWYAVKARGLPWRQTVDPYAIWISEIMLQQTQVVTVIPRFHAWMQQFPTIGNLANAKSDAVMKAWEGLGYYRRARMLHEAAKTIVDRHEGRFPSTFPDILALPGIGRSTAGAIASFCFGAGTPVLDGNIKRVLKRWSGNSEISDNQLWLQAQEAIDRSGQPAEWNQAMMELGATCCRPKRADCTTCPVTDSCISAFQSEVPIMKAKPIIVRNVHWLVHLYTCPERGVWLRQRPASGIWARLWTPPISELDTPPEQVPELIHQLTHRRLHLYIDHVKAWSEGEGRWCANLDQIAIPTGIRRLLEAIS